MDEIVSGKAPELLIESARDPLWQTATEPSDSVGGTWIWGNPPVPDIGTDTLGWAASLVLKPKVPE